MFKPKLLFLNWSLVSPQEIFYREKMALFANYFTCTIIAPVYCQSHLEIIEISGARFIPFLIYSGNSILRNIHTFFKIITVCLKEIKDIDVIISPNPLITGLTTILISKLLKAKSVIEVNGDFQSAFRYGSKGKVNAGLLEVMKDKIAKVIIPFVLKKADMVKLVYSKQLDPLKIKQDSIKKVWFPNFVPIKHFIQSPKNDNRYILLLGFPWYLKGVDILIKAFNKISREIPEYRLKVVGWCPEGREYFEYLAKDNEKIELCDPVYYNEVINLMVNSSVYVLASRTDSSPRVLREAMASKKPIIAANIDGVPELIEDGFNGLLFEKESVDDLSDKLLYIIKNPQLSKVLSENGFEVVQRKFSEQCYIEQYRSLIKEISHTSNS